MAVAVEVPDQQVSRIALRVLLVVADLTRRRERLEHPVLLREEELEEAKKAIMWSRLQGQAGEASDARLNHLKALGADEVYDHATLSDFGGQAGKDVKWDELKDALQKLTDLHREGLMTKAEFERKKQQLLDRL